MKKLNQKGALDMMFVVLLVVLLAFGGFVVWRVTAADNETADVAVSTQAGSESKASASEGDSKAEDASNNQGEAVVETSDFETKRIDANGTSYTVKIPTSWAASETTPIGDEHQLSISNGSYTLNVQLIKKELASGASTSQDNVSIATLSGYSDSEYHIHGGPDEADQNGRYELIWISACTPTHCYTDINATHDMNFSLRNNEITEPIGLSDIDLEEISSILQSIEIS